LHARASGFLADIFTEYRERKKGYRLAIKADFYQMALAYFRDGPLDNDSPPLSVMQEVAAFVTDRRLEPIYLLIFKDFDQSDLSLDRAARAAALSPFYVASLFKEQTGQSFYDYLTTVRVSHAMEYLLTTDLPVSLIADKCGFASQPTFHRVFKVKTGCSPVKYRRETKKQ
jgi:AraC-like DNA-binding protein